jgi:Immunity protein Imm1
MREFESRCLELKVNSSICDIRNVEALWAALKEVGNRQFCEVWLSSSDGGPALCALFNGKAAWLMYLRNDEGDPSYSTRNPDYTGPEDAKIEYRLENGQVDEYPAAWNITTPEALRALAHFFTNLERAPWLVWHEG